MKIKEKESKFTSTLSINPYNQTFYKVSDAAAKLDKKPNFEKRQQSIAFLNNKSFISTQVNISKNIPEEDLQDALENRVYEELALDLAIEYSIQFVEYFDSTDETNRHFHAFIVEPQILEEEFTQSVSAVKYIDQIVPIPLLLKSLYQKELILDSGVHCFIFIQEHDAFLAIYNNQDFIYTKSLKYSMSFMHETFCELLGEQVDYSEFITVMTQEGLGANKKEYQKHIIKLLGDTFLHVNDVLTYAKRAYNLENIDQIYIGSYAGNVPGVDEYSQTYLGVATDIFEFDYGFAADDIHMDEIHALMHVYLQQDEFTRYECNFTTYHRPPAFTQRSSGQLIIALAASIFFAFAYPVAYWSLTYTEKVHFKILEDIYQKTHSTRVVREATINLKEKQKSEANALLTSEKKAYDDKKQTLIKIHDVKVNYPMKAIILTEFTKEFNKYNTQLSEITYSENNTSKAFTFSLVAKKDRDITSLLKHLTKIKSKDFDFTLNKISYDSEKMVYTGKLKAQL
ncbi:MAG: hypothetical protein U9P71_00875 [Campylobacterota bacterium]|nr:hypothetical protein [Campylobacterota bacterium]